MQHRQEKLRKLRKLWSGSQAHHFVRPRLRPTHSTRLILREACNKAMTERQTQPWGGGCHALGGVHAQDGCSDVEV